MATYRNLIIVFFLTGLWHGAAWTYICWGLYQGVFLIAERIALRGHLDRVSLLARFVYFLPVSLIGWTIFRAADLDQAGAMIARWSRRSLRMHSFFPTPSSPR